MPSTASPERFVTLFDSSFLPQGLALHTSLRDSCPEAELWVIALDEMLERNIAAIGLAGLRTIPLREVENEHLLSVKPDRNAREYCWTLTPFSFDAVFARCPEALRVTYLDADLFFFSSPRPIFEELESSGAAILVTEHGFDPEYDKTEIVGRFCVQFLTMDNSERAAETRRWWQDRVLEWCYERREPGLFGDQKYLDLWPELFGDRMWILSQRDLSLAPWNVRMETKHAGGKLHPVFYHFHSFRLVANKRARTVEGGYKIPKMARPLYSSYTKAIGAAIDLMAAAGVPIPTLPIHVKSFAALRHAAKLLLGRADAYARIRSTK